MYAVIFRAEVNTLDACCSKMASQMREFAINEYGCIEFVPATEEKYEIALFYWQDLEAIKNGNKIPGI